MKTNSKTKPVMVIRWLARVLAVCLLVFFGAFFVEHVLEWFIRPFPQHPPLRVCVGMALHFLLLVGLLIALRWELAGSLMVIVTAFAFLHDKTGSGFPLIFGLTALPVLLLLFCWWHDRKRRGDAVRREPCP